MARAKGPARMGEAGVMARANGPARLGEARVMAQVGVPARKAEAEGRLRRWGRCGAVLRTPPSLRARMAPPPPRQPAGRWLLALLACR